MLKILKQEQYFFFLKSLTFSTTTFLRARTNLDPFWQKDTIGIFVVELLTFGCAPYWRKDGLAFPWGTHAFLVHVYHHKIQFDNLYQVVRNLTWFLETLRRKK